MIYKDFKESIKSLGFKTIEEFTKFIDVKPKEILKWEEQDCVPYMVSLIIHLLKGEKNIIPGENSLTDLIEECLPLATLLDEASSFPHKLEEMFVLQKRLNDDTNGKNWELGINKFSKEINWLRCIHMEISELIDSTPWKHWKNINAESDIDNIQIELVDIWHFIMSYILQETNIPKAVALANTHCIYEAYSEIDTKVLVNEAEKLSYICFAIQTGNLPQFSGIDRLIDQYFRCCKVSGLSFTWLQKLYIGKNCLNKFRQDNGYKEGTYIKEWNGVEDNVIMLEILNSNENIDFDKLYSSLEEKYKELAK